MKSYKKEVRNLAADVSQLSNQLSITLSELSKKDKYKAQKKVIIDVENSFLELRSGFSKLMTMHGIDGYRGQCIYSYSATITLPSKTLVKHGFYSTSNPISCVTDYKKVVEELTGIENLIVGDGITEEDLNIFRENPSENFRLNSLCPLNIGGSHVS